MKKQIPNLFTLINLFCGCMAIVSALQPQELYSLSLDIFHLPDQLIQAPFWIMAAAVVDFLDGFIARWLKAESKLGAQLDSLSDVVSFGVAPSVIFYQLLHMAFRTYAEAIDISLLLLMPAFLFALAAAWRLAVFNCSTEQRYSFLGVPTPMSGLVVASLPLIGFFNPWDIRTLLLQPWLLYAFILILSVMMIIPVRIMSLKVTNISLSSLLPQLLLGGLSILLIILFRWAAVPLIYVLYVVLSLVFRNKIN